MKHVLMFMPHAVHSARWQKSARYAAPREEGRAAARRRESPWFATTIPCCRYGAYSRHCVRREMPTREFAHTAHEPCHGSNGLSAPCREFAFFVILLFTVSALWECWLPCSAKVENCHAWHMREKVHAVKRQSRVTRTRRRWRHGEENKRPPNVYSLNPVGRKWEV